MCSRVVTRLAALEVQPVGVLVGAVGGVRLVVDAGGLAVGVPLVDLLAAGGHLRLLPRPVRADQVDHRPGAVAGDEVTAVARVVLGRDHLAGDVEALPAEPLEDRRQHGHQVVRQQDVEEDVDPAEVVGVQLAQPAVGQVLEADVEPLVEGAVARADGPHVRLHRHQQHGVEALGLAVACVDLDLLGRGPPRQRPGRVGHHQRRGAVGVDELATRGRHPPEAVLVQRVPAVRAAVEAGDGALAAGEPGVVDGRVRHPVPVAGVRRGEAQAPPVAAVPEGRPPQHVVAAREVGPDLDVGVRSVVRRRGGQLELDLLPRCGHVTGVGPFGAEAGEGHRALGREETDHAAGERRGDLGGPEPAVELGEQHVLAVTVTRAGDQADPVTAHGLGGEARQPAAPSRCGAPPRGRAGRPTSSAGARRRSPARSPGCVSPLPRASRETWCCSS